jgi:hypothetical protein
MTEVQNPSVGQQAGIQVPPGATPGTVEHAAAQQEAARLEEEEGHKARSRQEYIGWRQSLGWDQRLELVEAAIDGLLEASTEGQDRVFGTLEERIQVLEDSNAERRKADEQKSNEASQSQPAAQSDTNSVSSGPNPEARAETANQTPQQTR